MTLLYFLFQVITRDSIYRLRLCFSTATPIHIRDLVSNRQRFRLAASNVALIINVMFLLLV